MKTLRFVLLALALNAAVFLSAQGVYNYSCDFEDETENALWDLRIGADAENMTNKWYIDTAVNNGGFKSMYISDSFGRSATYSPSSCVVLASREITLAYTGSDYTLSFDWMAKGFTPDQGDKVDGLYVAFVPLKDYYGEEVYSKLASSGSTFELDPVNLKPYMLELNPVAAKEDARLGVRGASTWRSVQTTISKGKTNEPYRLVFVWRNTVSGVSDPAACVDNINILDGRACGAPSALKISTAGGDSLILDWKGDAERYEVGCYSYEKKTWLVYNTDTNHFVYTEVPEGTCDFYVRTICYDTINHQDYFSGKVMDSRFIYYPDNHCIDYITMTDDNCFTNTDDTKLTTVNDIDKVKWQKGMVVTDDPKTCRHLLCKSKLETDPNTGGKLKVVPDGELASVRLGNWGTGGESEMVEFKFHVDVKVNPILVVKYAVVLQHPGESCKPNPGFRLRVKRRNSVLTDPCAKADFDYRSAADKDWEIFYPNGSGTDVRWKQWTTVGLNLADFDGEDLTIQLTTYDCGGGGHYGYAYFVLGCDKDQLDGANCDGRPSTDFRAPSGFDYRWYLKNSPDSILSQEQTFVITDSLDSRTYCVDVISKEEPDCKFTLNAAAMPHYPVADFTYQCVPGNCENRVKFTNLSRQETVYFERGDTVIDVPDAVTWDFGKYKSLVPNPNQFDIGTLVFPLEGDTFPVTISSYLNNCYRDTTIMVCVPRIGETVTDSIVSICKNEEFTFRGTNPDGTPFIGGTYTETGIYFDTIVSSIGCDSIFRTVLTTNKLDTTGRTVWILEGDTYLYNDTLRTTPGVYYSFMQSQLGCDSIDSLVLFVHRPISVVYPRQNNVCAQLSEFALPYNLAEGVSCSSYSLRWINAPQFVDIDSTELPSTNVIEPQLLLPVEPNEYFGILTFYDSMRYRDSLTVKTIKDYSDTVFVSVLYPDSLLQQRWNDVIFVRNSQFNGGGWEFSQYQWYKNDQPVEGATGSYLYQALETSSTYKVLLTRQSDAKQIFSCDFHPVSVIDKSDLPNLLEKGQNLPMRGNGRVTWYNHLGQAVKTQSFSDSEVSTPASAGIYLLQVKSEESVSVQRVMVE